MFLHILHAVLYCIFDRSTSRCPSVLLISAAPFSSFLCEHRNHYFLASHSYTGPLCVRLVARTRDSICLLTLYMSLYTVLCTVYCVLYCVLCIVYCVLYSALYFVNLLCTRTSSSVLLSSHLLSSGALRFFSRTYDYSEATASAPRLVLSRRRSLYP